MLRLIGCFLLAYAVLLWRAGGGAPEPWRLPLALLTAAAGFACLAAAGLRERVERLERECDVLRKEIERLRAGAAPREGGSEWPSDM